MEDRYLYVLAYYHVLDNGDIDPANPWLSFKHVFVYANTPEQAYRKGYEAMKVNDDESRVNDYVVKL